MYGGPPDWSSWYERGAWPPPRPSRWAAARARVAALWARLRVVPALLVALARRAPRVPAGDVARPHAAER